MSNQDKPSLPQKRIQIKPIIRKTVNEINRYASEQEEFDIEQKRKELAQIEEETNRKLEQTNEEINALREQWEQERAQYVEQAQQEGYQQGFRQGEQDSLAQYQSLIDQANATVDLANQDYLRKLSQMDEQILQIAMAVAEKVIDITLEDNKESFYQLVKKALEQVKEQPSIKIYIHPDHYQLLSDNKEELQTITYNQAELSIYNDSSLSNGQAIIETPFGKIDASVETQLEEIRNKLFHLVEEISRGTANDS
ncbi:flagellar assembly protein FliH [Gracilibacillus ureilyticus]|uniref:flagellar assembly protein FliH n=1 Tax=Gracilibacillus ureilyticus TaxID=531814 RepID=UPI0015879BFA|nr:flagellar assembly protein FliH [Gracilibacillus ureilyticus]